MAAEAQPRGVLDPLTLSKIAGLQLRARTVAEGLMGGLHRSRRKGSNVEFAEHREYLPGDDPKHIDWRAYARLGRYYLRTFEEETSLRAYLAVDVSASMGYGRGPMTKLAYAVTAAASLAYLLLHQRDAVGLMLYGAGARRFLPARAGAAHFSAVAEALEGARPEGGTDVPSAVEELAAKAPRRALILFFSDFLDDPESAAAALASLRRRKHEVAAFQVLDADELTFPFEHLTRFESMEDDRVVQADPEAIRANYLEELARMLSAYRGRLLSERIDYTVLDASKPLDAALAAYLAGRERR